MTIAYAPPLIQDADDGPGVMAPSDDGKFMMWSQPDKAFVMAAIRATQPQAIGHFGGFSIQQAQDGPGALTIADDGKAVVWHQATGRFVMATPGSSDADTLDGHDSTYFLPAASYTAAATLTQLLTVDGAGSGLDADTLDGHDTSYFEVAGVAAAGLAVHVAAADPHPVYLLASGARTGGVSSVQSFNNGVRIVGNETPATEFSFRAGNTGAVELITSAVDRTFSGAGNWTGTNWAVSAGTFQHTTGSTADAVLANANLTASSVISGRQYVVTYTVSGWTVGTVTAKLGTVSGGAVGANGAASGFFTPTSDNVNLVFTPTSTFDGAISNISLKRVQNDFVILNNGKIGINTTSPTRYMQIDIYNEFFRINQLGLGNSGLELALAGVSKSFWGMAAGANVFITGSLAGDTVFRVPAAQSILFSANGATGKELAISTGLVGIGQNTGMTAFIDIAAGLTTKASQRIRVGVAPTTPNDGDIWHDGALTFFAEDATTSAIVDTLRLRRSSSGTPAAGFGVGISARLKSSTTANRDAGRLTWAWIDATEATRAAKGQLSAYYTTTERAALTWGANSTVPLLSFYDVVTPIARQLLATGAGATVDQVITALQNLGLLRQS